MMTNYKILSRDEQNELITLAKQGDILSRNKVIESNIAFIKYVGSTYLRNDYDMNDIICDGTIGVIKAIENFDVNKGFTFQTYAIHYITKEFQNNYVSKYNLSIPKSYYTKIRRIENENPNSNILSIGNLESNDISSNDESYLKFEDKECIKSINKIIDKTLKNRESFVIKEHYFNDKSYSEIGDILGISKQRVQIIHKNAITKLKPKLKDFYYV